MFAASLSLAQQSAPPVQLTQVPAKPTCTPLLRNGSCANLWRNYNDSVAQRTREELQLYVARQKELASSQATAPLQQLISDQQAQIKQLQEQMQSDSAAALQAKSDAHREGLQYGGGIGAGSMTSVIRSLPISMVEFRMGEKGYEEDVHRRIASVGRWDVNQQSVILQVGK